MGIGRHGGSEEGLGDDLFDGQEPLRLGEDVRFLLAVVGGGAVRVGERIARRGVRHLETVAINCDLRVQEADVFDRRVYLGNDATAAHGTGGSVGAAGRLAHAAAPALDRLFDGATVVTIVASLGGGTGTGALPQVIEAASRSAEFVSVFVIKPFAAEGERRATAERAIARLHFLGHFLDKVQDHRASLHILDNEELARHDPRSPFGAVADHWATTIAGHIEGSFIGPIEALVETHRIERPIEASRPPTVGPITPPVPMPHVPEPAPMPLAPSMGAGGSDGIAELTFEVFPTGDGPLEGR